MGGEVKAGPSLPRSLFEVWSSGNSYFDSGVVLTKSPLNAGGIPVNANPYAFTRDCNEHDGTNERNELLYGHIFTSLTT